MGTATLVMWQYCRNLNDINTAILENDPNWEGLVSADQIISISWDISQMCYIVFWSVEREIEPKEPCELKGDISW